MESWLERIQKKPEGTRRAIALGVFVVIMGVVMTLWLWNFQGMFPYSGVTDGLQSINSGFGQGVQNFQDFRTKLGEYKQELLNAVSSSPQMEQVASTTPDGNTDNASSTTESQY